jgi:DNA-binding CsgD family transcriptional regulator
VVTILPRAERPLIVADEQRALDAERVALEQAGWAVLKGWSLFPSSDWDVRRERVVCCGKVFDEDDAAAAVLAAARGAGLLIMLDVPSEVCERLLDDLRHLGKLEHRTSPDELHAPLNDEQRGLLQLLAEGKSIVEAAKALYLSRRTATRRLKEIRATLGVSSTSEALVVAFGRCRNRSAGPPAP